MTIASEDFIITLEDGSTVDATLEMYDSGGFDYGNGHGVCLITENADGVRNEQPQDARYDSRFDTEETFREHALEYVKEHVRPTCKVTKKSDCDNWIPVEKALPKKCAIYIVTLNYETTDFCFYYPDKNKWGWGDKYRDDVVAWQPFPKPYKKQ